MDQNRFGGWVQLLGNLAIVAGIVVVIYELNQNKQLAYAQLFSQGVTELDNQYLAMQGEDPRRAFFRAEFCPDELTGEDVVTLSAYYERRVSSWFNRKRSSDIGALDRPWEAVIKRDIHTMFSTPLARRWLTAFLDNSNHTPMREDIEGVITQTLSETHNSRQQRLYTALLPDDWRSPLCPVMSTITDEGSSG